MDSTKIKALLLAIEKKSFSKAAEELSYTPSAMSHIADSIECELGVKLLNRTFNGVELNENGIVLLPYIKALIDAEEELLKHSKKLESKNNHLRIGAYSSIAQHLLPDLIKKFKIENPDVKISIKIANNMQTWLKDDVVDIIFTDVCPSNSKWLKIMTDPFMAIVPSDVFAQKISVEKEELYPYPYIRHNESVVSNYLCLDNFKEIINFDSIDEVSILSMIKEKIGISVLPSLMVKKKSKYIRAIKLSPEISRTIGCAYNKDIKKNACALKFIKFLTTIYK